MKNPFLRSVALTLRPLLWWRSRPSLVQIALAGREFIPAPAPQGARVRAAAAPVEARLFRSVAEYVQALYQPTHRAVQAGAQLVVLPGDSRCLLAALIPGLAQFTLSPKGIRRRAKLWGREVAPGDLLRLAAPAVRRIFESTLSRLAAGFGVHLAAGAVCLPDAQGRLLKLGYLFGPDGHIIGTQAQSHLSPLEALLGLSPGEEIRVFETALGRISIPLCTDQAYFEPQRIAWLRGAEILVDPDGELGADQSWIQARDMWARVQESPAYGILACMVGGELSGQSGIFAPLEVSPAGDGIIAQAASGDGSQVVVADLDLAVLRRFRLEHAPQFNLDLYRRYLPAAYEAYRNAQQDGRRVTTSAPSPG